MKKKTMIIILMIHTILMIFVFPYSYLFNPAKESWPFFFAFFIDFPASIIFHKVSTLLKMITNNISVGFWWLTFSHFVLGVIWWFIIATVIIKLWKLVTGRRSDRARSR
ncbi:MAG: hypothetical protein CVU55_09675 [Deltaproteobacteria bacterium HGW-Deltaproteobacteria-13]|jgi:hypothetical protein|nr:MAG: hypothetical protein CVU55_09675 [Deltaproteobacteria bacterium HGW-Deltaproteobacteria-13]